MSQIDQLLKYQKEDEKLINIERETARSEERKRYVQIKNYLTKASERLDQLEANASVLNRTADRLGQKYSDLDEALKDFENIDEMIKDEGADVSFYKRSVLSVQDKIKNLKSELNSLIAGVKSTEEEYKSLKKKVIEMQKQFIETHTLYAEYRAVKKDEMSAVEDELEKIAKDIDPAIFAKYQAKRSERIFPIICEVNGDRCSKCGMELSLVGKETIASGGVIECENCHRFLYKK